MALVELAAKQVLWVMVALVVPQVSADSVAAPEVLVLVAMAAMVVTAVLVGPRHHRESPVASAVRAVREVQLRQAKQVMAVMAVTVVLVTTVQARQLERLRIRQPTVA